MFGFVGFALYVSTQSLPGFAGLLIGYVWAMATAIQPHPDDEDRP